eukprot:COSAG02_NODE_41555_length_393_cov_0.911565_2_plen_74_part_01
MYSTWLREGGKSRSPWVRICSTESQVRTDRFRRALAETRATEAELRSIAAGAARGGTDPRDTLTSLSVCDFGDD